MTFFESLNFASSNEDGRTERAALAGPAVRMVCLTGSGTRPLDMLLTDTAEVIAVDVNPVQNALLRLKIAAFRALDHAELLAFLGITPAEDRMALYARVAGEMTAEDRAFWDARRRMIGRGVWYVGRWEKVLRLGAKGIGLMRRRALRDLFAAPDVATQQAIWRDRIDDWLWRGSIRTLGRPWFWTRIIGEPGGAFLPTPDAVEARLAGAFDRAAGTFLFRESDFAMLMLKGCNAHPDAVPLHLMAQNFDHIRARLDDLQVRTVGLTDLAEAGITGVDRFSLSDFGSYTDAAIYAACWQGVADAAAPGAVFCERVFMNPLPIPRGDVALDEDRSAVLTEADRAIIYDIRVGTIG